MVQYSTHTSVTWKQEASSGEKILKYNSTLTVIFSLLGFSMYNMAKISLVFLFRCPAGFL